MEDNVQREVFDSFGAADYLGLSPSTLAKMRMTGAGPRYSKAGARILYRRQALEDWLAWCERRSTSEYTAA